jgi:hypothetical protein
MSNPNRRYNCCLSDWPHGVEPEGYEVTWCHGDGDLVNVEHVCSCWYPKGEIGEAEDVPGKD